jgi:hypothetical protein
VTAVAAASFHLSCAAPPPHGGIALPQARPPSVAKLRNITFSSVCVRSGLEQCFNAVDDDCNGHVDERCGTLDGLIQLVIAWDAAKIDVDLDVIDANGELARPDAVTQKGYIKDRDCPLDSTCGDQNTETVSGVDPESFRGPLKVAVRIKDAPPGMQPLRVQLGGHLGSRPISAWTILADANDRAEFEIAE